MSNTSLWLTGAGDKYQLPGAVELDPPLKRCTPCKSYGGLAKSDQFRYSSKLDK